MGIQIASNFDVFAALPIDSRMVSADLAARDAIDAAVRYEGLIVYVLADQTNYQLQGGTGNGDWVAIGGGGITTTAEFYVDGGTGNDSNPGTAALPFATIQKGVTEAAASIAEHVTLYIADGVYSEYVSVPTTGSGFIDIIGNTTIPASVIIQSPGAGFGTVFTHNNPRITVQVDGMNMIDGAFGCQVQAGNFISKGVGYSNCVIPFYATGQQTFVSFPENTTADAVFSSSGGAGSYCLLVNGGAKLYVKQDFTMLSAEQCMYLQDCTYFLASTKIITAVPSLSISSRGIVFGPGSDGVNNIGFEVDMTAPLGLVTTDANVAMEYNNCSQRIEFSSNINLDNSFYGIKHINGVDLNDTLGGNTYTFTACTIDVMYDQGTIFDIADQYDTTSSIIYVGTPNRVSGRAYLERWLLDIER